MLLIGSHVKFNSKEQVLGSVNEALSYGANTFMFYTGAPQNTKRGELSYDLTLKARDVLFDNNIGLDKLIVHAPYIINIANNIDMSKYEFSIDFLDKEIKRACALGVEKLVLHPGSFVSLDIDTGINNIINALNRVLKPNSMVSVCIETMAGKGTEIGFKLEHIKRIIDGVNYSSKVLVCLDTCHLNDAGYDISDFDSFLDMFDEMIGIDKIGCVHVNDSVNDKGAKKDRHANIGYGTIGFNNLINVIYNKRLENVPKILETPYIDYNGEKRVFPPYKFEIEMIKNKKFNKNLYQDVIDYYTNNKKD